MSEESTVEEEGDVFIRKHTPIWRSNGKPILYSYYKLC